MAEPGGTNPRVWPCSIAGTWYPASPEILRLELEGYLGVVPREDEASTAELRGLVVPHAGLRYSGRIAGAAYRLAVGADIGSVVIVGPAHRGGEGLMVLPDGELETPLGNLLVDAELADTLLGGADGVRVAPRMHETEHSVQIQLPFLRLALPDAKVVPMLMGDQSADAIDRAAGALVRAIEASERPVLLVASTDLSHYERREVASRLDGEVLARLAAFDPEGLRALLRDDPRHACGGGPLVAVMEASRRTGARFAEVLEYGDSGDASGDLLRVVGYGSAALYGTST